MRIGFAGSTSIFSKNILISLIKKNCIPYVIYLNIDKRSGRGLKKNYSIIKKIALYYNILLLQVNNLDKKHFYNIFSKLDIDIFFIAGYGNIIPYYYFNFILYNFFNFHPSILPKWKGASPIKRSILSGDYITGLSLIKLSRLIDKGPIYLQFIYNINKLHFNALENKISFAGSLFLKKFISNKLFLFKNFIYQNEKHNNLYAHKINKNNKFINWDLEKSTLLYKIQAISSWPGIFTGIKKNIN